MRLLDFMMLRGEVAVAGRAGRDRAAVAVREDVPFTETMTAAVGREIKDLTRWLSAR